MAQLKKQKAPTTSRRSKKSLHKPVNRRKDLDREFNSGQWTLARMRSFVMSALRRAAWQPKYLVINRAYVRDGINPATGCKCKIHRCEQCGREGPKGIMCADHDQPVIPLDHNWESLSHNFLGYDWNEVMRRLWIEVDNGWNVVCDDCHGKKTSEERLERAAVKKQGQTDLFNP